MASSSKSAPKTFVGAITLCGLLLNAASARADKVEPKGKGLAGGALLGTEIAVVSEAVAGVQSPWLYASGIALAGGGGAVGGYYIDKTNQPGLSMTMLFAGMALLIPASIVYLDATSDDDEPMTTSETPPGQAPSETPVDDAGAALIELKPDTLRVSWVPPVQVRQAYSLAEIQSYGVQQRSEFLFGLLGGSF